MSNEGTFNIEWVAEHKRGERLISRQGRLDPPAPLNCMEFKMVVQYFKDSMHYMARSLYQTCRVHYAESHSNKKINEKYRTGDNAPKHTITLLMECCLIKVKEAF